MKRREFLASLLVTGAATRRAASAAPSGTAAIGLLVIDSPAATDFQRGLKEELRNLGYIEGRNVHFEFRAGEVNARLPELAEELVRDKVDVIVTWLTPTAMAAKAATHDIPIVMGTAGNPVETGLIESLSRPGGNVTGIAGVGAEVAGKLVELVREALPSARRIAALCLASDPFSKPYLASIQSNAAIAGMTVDPVWVQSRTGLDAAFAEMAHNPPDAIIAQPSLGLERPPELALKYRIPAVSIMREFAGHGGLLSYGTDYPALYKTVAIYVQKILKGAKPANLPVDRPSKFTLTVNLETAKKLGLALPQSLLLRADEVFE